MNKTKLIIHERFNGKQSLEDVFLSVLILGRGYYYDKPWEVTADVYGGVQSRNPSAKTVAAGFEYLENGKIGGPLILLTVE